MIGTRTSLYLAILLMYGCTVPQTQLQQAQAASTDESIVYKPGELNEESLLDLLSAELAGQQRDFDLAYDIYLRQAKLNSSAALAERATRIAQFTRDPQAVIDAATLWREIAEQQPEPTHILINILLQELRVAEALSLLEQQDEISAEILLIVESLLDKFDQTNALRLVALFDSRLDTNPEQLDLILVQAKLLAQLDQNDRAMTLLDRGLKIESLQPDLIVEKAQLLRRVKNQPEAALTLVERALNKSIDHRQLQAVQVQLLLELKPDSVETAVERAITQADNDPQLIYYYALLLMESEQHSNSLSLFQRLVDSDPARTDLYLYIGMLEEALGNTEAAIKAYVSVESGDNLLNAINRALQLLDAQTELERAKQILADASESSPDQAAQLSVIFARWAADEAQLQAGLDLLASQLDQDPDNITLLYSRALLIEPLDPTQMLQDLEHAYNLNPDNAATQNALGYSLLEHSSDYKRAYKLISKALSENPEDPAYLDSMGWALHKLGRDTEALVYLEQAFELMQDPEVASHLIIVLSILEQTERARSLIEQQFDAHPDNEDLKEALRWLER